MQDTGFTIGDLHLRTPLVMAPMADLTHAPFRELVAGFGGCGLFYTEMLNSRIIAARTVKNDPLLIVGRTDRPLFAQLLGNEPEAIADSITILHDRGYAGFDLNMGCSKKRICNYGWGIGLMKDINRARLVVRAAKKATGLPLTVKIRSGITRDGSYLLDFTRMLADEGVDAVTLHPRTAGDGFKRKPLWREIETLAANLSIPIIGNGDVFDMEDADRMLATGCSAVMIGRGALIRPWIFHEITSRNSWTGNHYEVFAGLAGLIRAHLPPELQAKRFFLNAAWLLRNWPFYHTLTSRIRGLDGIDAMLALIREAIEKSTRPMLKKPVIWKL